jgi:hypothetical protein
MSSADAAFAVAQAVEKVAKAIDAHRESLDQLIMSVNFQRANTVPAGKPATAQHASFVRIQVCNRCHAPLKMKDGKIDWLKMDGKFYPQNPDGSRHSCSGGATA